MLRYLELIGWTLAKTGLTCGESKNAKPQLSGR